jgi:hypothetical protein
MRPNVDLRGRLSNPDMREVVASAAQAVSCIQADDGQGSSSPSAPRRWKLVDRLGEQILRDLLKDSGTGATKHALAQRYGISLSSVKRLLRRDQSGSLR